MGILMIVNNKQQIRIYRPNQRHELSWLHTWHILVQNFISSKEFIWQLFKRDYVGTYKKSFLGVAWIFIAPVLGIISWVFLKETGLLQPGEMGIPYPAYVLIGTSMWGLFVGFYNAAQETLTAGKDIVMQINYSHEALLIKQTAQHLADFSITLLVTLLVLALFGILPVWQSIFFPLVVIPIFFLGAGLGLIGSMIAIVAVDLTKLANVVLTLLMWASPIIYTSNIKHPLVQTINHWNPLTYLVCSARDIIIYGRLFDTTGFFISAAISLIIFMLSWRLFFISEDSLIERMI